MTSDLAIAACLIVGVAWVAIVAVLIMWGQIEEDK